MTTVDRRGSSQCRTELVNEVDVLNVLLGCYQRSFWHGVNLACFFYGPMSGFYNEKEWDRLQSILETLFDTYRFVDKKSTNSSYHYKYFINRPILFEMWQSAVAWGLNPVPEDSYIDLLESAGMA